MPISGWNRRGLLALLATPGFARAEVPELRGLVGEPISSLAAHPAVGPRLRRMTAGRQRAVSEALRGPGAPIGLSGSWLHGTGAAEEGRVLLGFDWVSETVALLLIESGRPSLFVPPRIAPWPLALREAVSGFAPELAAAMRFV
jgi:hypothetical protein